ncbi:alpha and gamma adaptin binding protein p34-domain-containing protein [Powellomyces hirtus]|nr:alpha and gamma adaptin binding protein p34-domain-containing protein [Powellomyces hirtus]
MLAKLIGLEGDEEDVGTAAPLKNKCLILGLPGVGKCALIGKLIGPSISSASRGQTTNGTASDTVDLAANVIPLTITTKYYRANVALWVDSIGESPPNATEMKHWCEIGAAVVDAFVFVYDREKPETFLPLRDTWAKFVEQVSPSIALCIANTLAPTSSPSAHSLAEHEQWCIEHDIEHIDMEVQPENGAANGDAKNDDVEGFQERLGIDRVIEALETNMWEGMVLAAGGPKSSGHGAEERLQNTTSENAEDDVNHASGAVPPRRLLIPQFDDEEDEEGDIDEDLFERSIRALQGLRDHGSNLPDEERRALAARIALSLGLDTDSETENETQP